MKRILWTLLALLLLAGVGLFGVAPGFTESRSNRVERAQLPAVRQQSRALHASLVIADMHSDTLLWRRSLIERATRGHVDVPRLLEGNVALQVFSSVTKVPSGQNYDANGADSDRITLLSIAQLQPPRTWGSLLERSLWHAQKLDRYAAGSAGALRVVRTPQDLEQLLAERARGSKVVGAMLSIEGLQSLEGQLANLDRLYAAGFRMAGFAHFFDNDVTGSMHGTGKGGLTPLGRQVVVRMEQLGMIVDIAHVSHAAVAEILALARRPVVSSHGGVQATCKFNRNLTDAEIRGIARTGGVVGIGYWEAAVCSTQPRAVAQAIAHVRSLVGIDHVGLGSDFDGAVTTGFDTSQLVVITQALVDLDFSAEDIRKVMGGNVIRVLREGLRPLPGTGER